MWQHFYRPITLAAALDLLQAHPTARPLAGGTDLVVEQERGVRPTDILIDLSALHELRYVRREGASLAIGALATHNDLIASADCVAAAFPLAQACLEIGAPPIRTRATLAGNLITASPANDTITPLLALDAELVLVAAGGERRLPLREFYLGVRRTALQPGELLREIRLPLLETGQRGIFCKLGLRRAQAIAVVNTAVVITTNADDRLRDVRITLGCVAPTIIRAAEAEQFLAGRTLTSDNCAEAGRLAAAAVSPIDDVRGSAAYRRAAVAAIVSDALNRLAAGSERAAWPQHPVLLETAHTAEPPQGSDQALPTVGAVVNGETVRFHTQHTLLDALREDAGLTGTKEGCAEGECGACTVWMDGKAVMACLVPAGQAAGAQITTIEGLAAQDTTEAGLHPLQAAFIANGAVQCGYCIPGMLMAGAQLLAEHPQPDLDQVRAALGGNICRCTGYRKIFDAVLAAAQQSSSTPQE